MLDAPQPAELLTCPSAAAELLSAEQPAAELSLPSAQTVLELAAEPPVLLLPAEPVTLALPPAPTFALPEGKKPESIRTHFRTHRRLYVIAFLGYLAVHLFLFRGVLSSLPDLLTGRTILSTSELVPFFDTQSQLIDQVFGGFSELTHGVEFRVRYSFLTTWMRHYQVLPFAIVLAPLLGAFLLFVVISLFLCRLSPATAPPVLIRGAALGVLLLHLIILQAKITHFYTLLLGFHLFAIAIVLLLHGLFLSRRPVRWLAAASILTLLNPAVHFLLLYGIVTGLFCIGSVILLRFLRPATKMDHDAMAPVSLSLFPRLCIAAVFLIFLTLIPYALFVKFFVLRGITNLADTVPDTYLSIKAASLPLLHQLSLDMSSATDNFVRGGYIGVTPHLGKIFYMLLALLPVLAIKGMMTVERRIRVLLFLLFSLLLFSPWSSLGYPASGNVPTFHVVLAALYNVLYASPGRFADLFGNALAAVINVLRSPDRFQFIGFAVLTILLPLGIAMTELRICIVADRWPTLFRRSFTQSIFTLLFIVLFFIPVLSPWESRASLLSGDFGGLLAPYPVAPLRMIKQKLLENGPGRTVVLPPSETPRFVEDSNGIDHKFIDKFFLYFLDQPSYYYGLTGDMGNKKEFFLMMAAMQRGEHWWVNAFRNLQIRYLIVNKELMPGRSGDPAYFGPIERTIEHQPKNMPTFFKLLTENDRYTLYEFIDPQDSNAKQSILNLSWSSYICLQETDLSLTKTRHFLAPGEPIDPTVQTELIAEDIDKSLLDLYARTHPQNFVRPDQTSFAFNPDHIPSTSFFGTIFPMLNLFTPSRYNTTNIVMPGPYDTLTSTFVALPKPTTIRFPVTIAEEDTVDVYLRAAATRHALTWQLGTSAPQSRTIAQAETSTSYATPESVVFGPQKTVSIANTSIAELSPLIPKSIAAISDHFDYIHLGTAKATRGDHWLTIEKLDGNPLAIEGVLILGTRNRATVRTPPDNVRITNFQTTIPHPQ